jgi:malonyl-CoA O-methyltransferase
MDDEFTLDTAWVRRSFDRASSSYDAVAVLQTEIRTELLQRLELTTLNPQVVLDAGAGTGHASRALARRYPKAQVLAVDTSAGMLRAARAQNSWRRPFERVGADAERLPFKSASVDLIFSNLLLPWCDPDRLFAEFRRVLRDNGCLTCTGFGPDTLRELRSAWDLADAQHSHVNRFIDMHDLGDALVRAGFAAPVLDVERYTLQYENVRALARDLKTLGARNFTAGRRRGLTGRTRFAAMIGAYERFRAQSRLPATYEIVFAQAWAPAAAISPRDDGARGARGGGGPGGGGVGAGNVGAETRVALAELERQLRERRGS